MKCFILSLSILIFSAVVPCQAGSVYPDSSGNGDALIHDLTSDSVLWHIPSVAVPCIYCKQGYLWQTLYVKILQTNDNGTKLWLGFEKIKMREYKLKANKTSEVRLVYMGYLMVLKIRYNPNKRKIEYISGIAKK